MFVTEIRPLNKKKSRILFDDGEDLVLYNGEIRASRIKEQEELPDAVYEKLAGEVLTKRAKHRAMYLLLGQRRTKKELEDKLKRKLGEESAKIATEKMEKIGLLNDENYAREFANHLQKNKMYAKKRIAYELSKKGINDETISEVLNNLEMDEDETLEKIVSKKTIENEKDKRRLIAHLMRLGYSWSQINRFLKSEDY